MRAQETLARAGVSLLTRVIYLSFGPRASPFLRSIMVPALSLNHAHGLTLAYVASQVSPRTCALTCARNHGGCVLRFLGGGRAPVINVRLWPSAPEKREDTG